MVKILNRCFTIANANNMQEGITSQGLEKDLLIQRKY